MKRTMKLIWILFIVIIPGNIIAQGSSEKYLAPDYNTEKFNKRGYYNNRDAVVDGNEIISDYDGNLMLKFSSKVNYLEGLSGEFSVLYNLNVSHKIFRRFNDIKGLSINNPEWIIGYKGFALQTLNYETNFNVESADGTTVKGYFSGQEIPMLIPGYHYTNSFLQFWEPEGIYGYHKYDEIRLLRADGSVMVLQNTETNKKDGLYQEIGIGSTGYAKVVIYQSNKYRCRHIYYKPGNGLTYTFTEEPVYYAYKGSHFPGGSYENSPKIAYLKEIRAKNRKISFEYQATPKKPDAYKQGVYESMGRKIFTRASFGFFYGKEEFSVTTIGLNQERLTGFTIYNNNTNENLRFKTAFHSGLFNNHRNFTQKLNRQGYIYEVVDDLERSTKIDYYPYNEGSYTDTRYIEGRGYHLGQTQIKLYIHSQIIKEINWFNGRKTRYEYVNKYFDQSRYNSNGENLADLLEDPEMNLNLGATGRDCYANYMLRTRTGFEGNNVKWIEKYNYFIGAEGKYFVYASKSEELQTSIKRSNASGNGGGLTNKKYCQYNTRFYNKNTNDYSKTIKLIEETKFFLTGNPNSLSVFLDEQNTIALKSYYEGTLRKSSIRPKQYLYDGHFGLKTLKTSKYGSLNKALETNYNYGFDNLVINNTGTIIVKKYKESIDASGTRTRITYKNIKPGNNNPTQLNDENFVYKLYLPEREYKAGNPGNNNWQTISDKSYQYDYLGRVQKIKDNLRNTYSTFSYNPDQPLTASIGSKAGLLSSKTNSQGVVTTLGYKNSEEGETIYGKIVTYDGSTVNTQKLNTAYPFVPIGKHISGYGGPVQSVKTEYNKRNDLTYVVDENGYFSVYEYDKVGRLKRVILPGSFFDGSSCGIGLLGYGNYKNIKHYNFNAEQTHMSNYDTHPIVNNSYVNGGGQYYSFKASAGSALNIPSNMVKAKLSLRISSSLIPESLPSRFKMNFIDDNGNTHHSKIVEVPLSYHSHSKDMFIDVTNDLNSMRSSGKSLKTLEFRDIETSFSTNIERSDISVYQAPEQIKKQRKFLITGNPNIKLYDRNIDLVNNAEESISYEYFDSQRKVEVTQQIEKQAEQNELLTTHIFDAFGNETETKTGNKTVSRQGWDVVNGFNNSSRVYQTDNSSYETKYYYDISGRLIKILYADGSSKETKYRLVNSSYAGLCRSYNESKYYEVKIDVDETYNKSSGRLNWNTKKGKTYSFFDKAGNLVEQVKYPEENKRLNTTYEYDCRNRLIKVTTPENISTTYGYDQWGNINSKSSPDFGRYTYRYDRYGNLKYEQHNSEGKYIYHIYDKLNRLLKTGIKTGGIPSSGDQAISSSDSELVLVNNYDIHRAQGVFSPGNPNYPSSYNSSGGNHIGRLTSTAYRDLPGGVWKYKFYKYDQRGNVDEVQVCE